MYQKNNLNYISYISLFEKLFLKLLQIDLKN